MPSFLREVLTAQELDELGLNDAIRVGDVLPPKYLSLGSFFRLRLCLMLATALDAVSIPLIAFGHYKSWDLAQGGTRPSWLSEVPTEGLSLIAGGLYASIAVLWEIVMCIPLRQQPGSVPELEARHGIHSWDVASCWNTFMSKLQIILDLTFALDCFKCERSILGTSASLTLALFYFVPRAVLSAFSISLLFRPTPPKTSIIDFIGCLFGFKPSRRVSPKIQTAAFSFPTLRCMFAAKSTHRLSRSKEGSEVITSPLLVHRKQALGVSYPSLAYSCIKYFCYIRLLAVRCIGLFQYFSPARRYRSSRELRRSMEEPLQSSFDDPNVCLSRLATKTQTSTLSPSATSRVEVEMENRNHEHSGGEGLRRSRGFVVTGANWIEALVQPTVDEVASPEPALEPESSSWSEYKGWRRQSLSGFGPDFYGSVLNTMSEIETTAFADDSKTVELAALGIISECYLTQDTLKEDYVAPDYHEELEFLQTLELFLRLHITNLLLNLLRFHCLMSSSFKDSSDWFMLFGIIASLIHGVVSFFYASFDQAVIDELMDDD